MACGGGVGKLLIDGKFVNGGPRSRGATSARSRGGQYPHPGIAPEQRLPNNDFRTTTSEQRLPSNDSRRRRMNARGLGWSVFAPQGGPVASRRRGMTPPVRFPDHTWKHFKEPLDSSFSQFQRLEITGHPIQGESVLLGLGLPAHCSPSLENIGSLKNMVRRVASAGLLPVSAGSVTRLVARRIFFGNPQSLTSNLSELPFTDLADLHGDPPAAGTGIGSAWRAFSERDVVQRTFDCQSLANVIGSRILRAAG